MEDATVVNAITVKDKRTATNKRNINNSGLGLYLLKTLEHRFKGASTLLKREVGQR